MAKQTTSSRPEATAIAAKNAQHAQSVLYREPEAFATALAQWFRRHRRILPWREQPSAYKTVVSELMLQQTQVVTALPYFERWIARWPDFASLAQAAEADVLQMWEGLGYYTRARNLLKLARAWVAAADKPQSAAQWLAYPGVGPYTAAAIASIAFGEHAAVVDGNVVRILTRLGADETAYANAALSVKAVGPLAQRIIEHAAEPGLHNEAMMELGATLCRKGQVQCLICPVIAFCDGHRLLGEGVAQLPRISRKQIENRVVSRAFVLDATGERVLLHRYGATSRRLAGLCELPLTESLQPAAVPRSACVCPADAPSAPPAALALSAQPAAPALSAPPVLSASPEPPDLSALPAPSAPPTADPVSSALPAPSALSADPASQITSSAAASGLASAAASAPGEPLLVKHRGIANERIEERIYAVTLADGFDAESVEGLFWQPVRLLAQVTLTGPHRRWLETLLQKSASGQGTKKTAR